MITKEVQRWRDRLIEKGRKEGRKEGVERTINKMSQSIIDALAERFGPLPEALATAIKAMKDVNKLLDVFSLSTEATSLDDFSRRLQTV